MKVLGLGWAKTGTTSLAQAVRRLGYKHKSQDMDLVDRYGEGDWNAIKAIAQDFDSFEDWPWLLLYRQFDEWFPGTKFVLTVRDEEAWLPSLRKQWARVPHDKVSRRRREVLYGAPVPDISDQQLLGIYRRHNEGVREYFKDRPQDLAVFDWTKGHGWHDLCAFLDEPLPIEEFPRANSAPKSMIQNLKQMRYSLLRS